MFQIKCVWRKSKHILCSIPPPPEDRAVYVIMRKLMPPMGDSPNTTQEKLTKCTMNYGKTRKTTFQHSIGGNGETHYTGPATKDSM